MDQRPQARATALRVLDVLTAAAPLALTLALPGLGTPETVLGQGLPELLTCGALITIALAMRRRHPLAAVLVCSVGNTAAMLWLGSPTALVLAVFIALFTLAVSRPVRTAVWLWALTSALQLVGELATGGWDQRVLAPLALMAASTAVGVAVRQQRIALRSARERAEIAERNGQQEAARRVADERLRIARELHDVVAHHVAVMGVQAGVAGHLMEADPGQARNALAQVRASGRTAIAELGALVGLLRKDDDDSLAAPAPGLAQLPELIATLRSSGLEVRAHRGAVAALTSGTRSETEPETGVGAGRAGQGGAGATEGDLDEMSDITAYRIVQESLTNALRHGTGSVDLSVERTSTGVDILVSNQLPAHRTQTAPDPSTGSTGTGGGHGLVGMRERAALIGADVSAGPTGDGRFEVRARLPRRLL